MSHGERSLLSLLLEPIIIQRHRPDCASPQIYHCCRAHASSHHFHGISSVGFLLQLARFRTLPFSLSSSIGRGPASGTKVSSRFRSPNTRRIRIIDDICVVAPPRHNVAIDRFSFLSITDSMCLPSRIRHGQSSLFWRNRVWFCSLAVELLGLMMDAIGEQA